MRIFRKSWLGNLNFFLLQWFFIRLAKHVDDAGKIIKWSILKGIVPLTGWWSNYKYVWRKK